MGVTTQMRPEWVGQQSLTVCGNELKALVDEYEVPSCHEIGADPLK